jgi:hypothetical protein
MPLLFILMHTLSFSKITAKNPPVNTQTIENHTLKRVLNGKYVNYNVLNANT